MTGGFGRVDVFAAAAIELDGLFVGDVCEADGEERLGLAKDPWATTEVGSFVFLQLRHKTFEERGLLGWDGGTYHLC